MKFQGKIENQGTYKELMDSQTDFAHLLAGGAEETENKETIRKLSMHLSTEVSYSAEISFEACFTTLNECTLVYPCLFIYM
jgi:hypothetical protein